MLCTSHFLCNTSRKAEPGRVSVTEKINGCLCLIMCSRSHKCLLHPICICLAFEIN
ncbi:hypothetical protein KSS87_012016 [Heliosperma pusillum]|nr:hypothetical protein KSS87_012016 [Heliosperma pusillum]